MNRIFVSFAFLSIFSLYGFGQMTISGQYSGKNIYILNPFQPQNLSNYCTNRILINGEEYEGGFDQSAYEIVLDPIDFKIGDPIKVEIFHKDDCEPKLVNEDWSQVSE